MNNKLFLPCAVACLPPWGAFLIPAGITAQQIGVVIQLAGLIAMIVLRKKIWN